MLRTASAKPRELITKESFFLLPHFRSDGALIPPRFAADKQNPLDSYQLQLSRVADEF